jgi:hypothetical protein
MPMTTIIRKPGHPHRPRTHAFVIGVGAYRYLRGGPEPRRGEMLRLGQLSSPPISARHFTDWLLQDFHHPTAELGTVELLLSEWQPSSHEGKCDIPDLVDYSAPDRTESWDIEAATIDNIEAAYARWRERCDEDPGNVALFYYCGHGVLIGGDHILLAQDYGANPLKAFDGAFNSDALRRGMTRAFAGLQCFFIDACSNVPIVGLELRDSGVRSFEATTWTYPAPSPRGVALDATAPGDSAYGDTGEVSRFTDALVRCLNGLGARRRGGLWTVNSNILPAAVEDVMAYLHQSASGPLQRPTAWITGNGPLHESTEPPRVPVVFRLAPENAGNEASLALSAFEDQTPRWERALGTVDGSNGTVWAIDEVPAGRYRLTTDFPTGRFRAQSLDVLIEPPGPCPDPDPINCEEIP